MSLKRKLCQTELTCNIVGKKKFPNLTTDDQILQLYARESCDPQEMDVDATKSCHQKSEILMESTEWSHHHNINGTNMQQFPSMQQFPINSFPLQGLNRGHQKCERCLAGEPGHYRHVTR